MHRQTLAIEVRIAYVTWMSIEHTALIVVVEHRNLVLVVGGVEVDHPREILGANWSKVKIELHTAVDHITHIVVRTGITA